MQTLTHFNHNGRAAQVDVGVKPITLRWALAQGQIRARPSLINLIRNNRLAKGDALTIAKIAVISAAKQTVFLIPLCHPVNLDRVEIRFEIKRDRIIVLAEASAQGKTGVEMEALSAVGAACLTLYDMAKSADKGIVIGPIYLLEKKGGRSGHYKRRGSKGARGR